MSPVADPLLASVLSHSGFVRALAHALLRGDDRVEDAVQETWLAAVTRGPTSSLTPRSASTS